ncbi:hypothetical protein Pla175_29980 [Pirellulimonas nuda]|uniref:Uncharacterized protein n=1 Tax=Pirellulimonas nuda TaxID=2528009 RepID=A0A518DDP3_9BACT|nr:hypothetical protein [Pirellulimonas nuda]QDU89605.1 hypothetical protein Pla175_29980 [Pirellulimonas nuda]
MDITVVLSVIGGVVQEAYANSPGVRALIVDWDAQAAETQQPSVQSMEAAGIHALWGSDLEHTIEQSGHGELLTPAAKRGVRDPGELDRAELEHLARWVQERLYLDRDARDEPFWNPDKRWSGADLGAELAVLLELKGLTP